MNNRETPSRIPPKVQLIELAVVSVLTLPAMVLSFFSFKREVPFTLFAAGNINNHDPQSRPEPIGLR